MANGRRGERGGGGSRTKAATQGIPRSLQPLPPPLPPPPPERAIYGVGRGRGGAAGSATRATLFSLLACVRARQQGWVKITEEGDSQTLWTVSLPLCVYRAGSRTRDSFSCRHFNLLQRCSAGKITIIQSHSSHPFFLQ